PFAVAAPGCFDSHDALARPLDRECASTGLCRPLFPFLHVHAPGDQPKAERRLTDECGNENGGKYPTREFGVQKQRETVRQIAQTCNLHQNTDGLWEKPGPDDQIPDNETRAAEEDQADTKAIAVLPDREIGENVQLRRLECLQVWRIRQRKQPRNETELARGF